MRLLEQLDKKYNSRTDVELEEMNVTSNLDGGEGQPRTPYAFTDPKKYKKDKTSDPYTEMPTTDRWFKQIAQYTKRLGEGSYTDFKKDILDNPKIKINSAISDINSNLAKLERCITHLTKLQMEINVDGNIYYKDTSKKFKKISERLNRISMLIRELNK